MLLHSVQSSCASEPLRSPQRPHQTNPWGHTTLYKLHKHDTMHEGHNQNINNEMATKHCSCTQLWNLLQQHACSKHMLYSASL
jgi:hypothetical protein